ncbi:MAG: hypothetical protein AAGC64_02765 [Bacteroidota bacterium]
MELNLKLDLKKAIILGDYGRLERGERVINSLRNLARELVEMFPERYKWDGFYDVLMEVHRNGTNDHQLINDIESLTGIGKQIFTSVILNSAKLKDKV